MTNNKNRRRRSIFLFLLLLFLPTATSIHLRATQRQLGDVPEAPETPEVAPFFPATKEERKAAKEAPTDPTVEEAQSVGEAWQPFVPHGIDLGATSMLTGNAFMQTPVYDRFRKYTHA